MAYSLSATKLKAYAQCPRAYYFRYEHGLKGKVVFGSAALGSALHGALAQLYQEWHYQDPLPSEAWVRYCWDSHIQSLSSKQIEEGWAILQRYFKTEILPKGTLTRPLATEGRIQGTLLVNGLEFKLTGRYDRLDVVEEGLELIDYKSAKHPTPIAPEQIDLQLGLYYLALEQHYKQALKRTSLVYLRTGEKVVYEVMPTHKQQLEKMIGELALQLREEEEWQPKCGDQCNQCSYARFCPAMQVQPEPLPVAAQPKQKLQLCLSL